MNIQLFMLIFAVFFIKAAEPPTAIAYKGAASAMEEMKQQRARYYPGQLPAELRAELMHFYKDWTTLRTSIYEILWLLGPLKEKLQSIADILRKPEYAYLINEPELLFDVLMVIANDEVSYIYSIAFDLNVPAFTRWLKEELRTGNSNAQKKLADKLITLAKADRLANADAMSSIKRMLALGISPNVQDNNGVTPLMRAAFVGKYSIVKLLLEAGADPNLSNYVGFKAIDFARRGLEGSYFSYYADVIRLLEKAELKVK